MIMLHYSSKMFYCCVLVPIVRIILLLQWLMKNNIFIWRKTRPGIKILFVSKKVKAKALISQRLSYEKLLEVVYHISRLNPIEYFLSMEYIFNVIIPTTPIQLTYDGDVKFFICLNCTIGKLPFLLCREWRIMVISPQSTTFILNIIHHSRLKNDRIKTQCWCIKVDTFIVN